MKGLILLQALADQSTNADEVMKQSEELKKQIADLQDTLISTQNDKISSLIGDIGVIVGVFGLIFTLLSLVSAGAIIYIQSQNKKAQENMEKAKELSENAEKLNKKGNNINQQASEELKEVQKKMSELDYLMKFTQKHSLAFTKINRCRSNVEKIKIYTDVELYQKTLKGVFALAVIKQLKPYSERLDRLVGDINLRYDIVNALVDSFYKYVDKVEEISHMQVVIDNIDKELKRLVVLESKSESLLEEVYNFYKGPKGETIRNDLDSINEGEEDGKGN
ncbi:hypothetical protein P2R64_00160 [Priestia megaterium]|uniref:hypothetical protein n=1 Tax=Priestia megaterium TaxID=1404 RepID=UPI0021C0CAEA|nr:hypothetical protein [Priestia megaterium]MCT9858226.1 hypothetical protein [Priestia megaterium]MDF1958473.1 hypothetical protein [Priestia megaterium]